MFTTSKSKWKPLATERKTMEATTALMWLTVITVATPSSDNVTQASFDYNVSSSPDNSPSSSTSAAAAASSSHYISPTVAMAFKVSALIIVVVGFLANAYVLLALLFSKKSRGSNVNVFITHQTILDLTACAILFTSLMLSTQSLKMNDSLALFVCWFFKTSSMSVSVGNASICGLVIITVERYVKIVHAVAYRNHYRRWMTRVGIIFPWIFGACTGFIPIWVTSKVIRGRCVKGSVGSNLEQQVTYRIAKFLLLYLGPLAVFVFGYSKILAVIRRQRKQVGQSQGTFNAAAAAEEKSKRSEMNVVRTMVLVSVTFAVCFVCIMTYPILTALKAVPAIGTLFLLFAQFSYATRCLNPFIYATQYEVVTRWWKVMRRRVVRGQSVEGPSIAMPAAPDTGEKQQSTKIQTSTKNL